METNELTLVTLTPKNLVKSRLLEAPAYRATYQDNDVYFVEINAQNVDDPLFVSGFTFVGKITEVSDPSLKDLIGKYTNPKITKDVYTDETSVYIKQEDRTIKLIYAVIVVNRNHQLCRFIPSDAFNYIYLKELYKKWKSDTILQAVADCTQAKYFLSKRTYQIAKENNDIIQNVLRNKERKNDTLEQIIDYGV